MDKKLDVVYILRNASTRWRNQEIKYSLRSISKNLLFNKVWIVTGELPRFIDGDRVGLIKANDPYANKLRNAIHKISLACKDDRVTDDFILMNDDFYFLKPSNEVEYFNKGRLESAVKYHATKGGYYYRAIRDTVQILRDMGIAHPIDFEVHYPIIFNKKKFIETIDKVSDHEAFLFRSIYGNINNIKSKYRKDIKVFNQRQFERTKILDFMSTDEKMATTKLFKNGLKENSR